ncbi:MAG TPA: polysaccharide deacetylase family protein [Stellaceae bacterium]|nr:polysaccharide deacetylase family protein [Stellaceae bacterium]
MAGAMWPRGKRIAILVSVLLENWSEGRSPTYFPRTTPLKPGAIDHGGVEWSHYGGREGVWRLLRVLDRAHVRATVFANGRSVELYPEAARAALAAGHDLGGHSYAQDQYLSDLAPDAQQALIRRMLDIFEGATGKRPTGWVSNVYSATPETPGLLVREGVRWYADALDCSLPRLEKTPAGEIAAPGPMMAATFLAKCAGVSGVADFISFKCAW